MGMGMIARPAALLGVLVGLLWGASGLAGAAALPDGPAAAQANAGWEAVSYTHLRNGQAYSWVWRQSSAWVGRQGES